ncbi:HBR376Cp [Eremothecium sinecaudum]|uniref:HBR376Cp n=1 Tax=Eremothecium sinecaudum TaxID=45286 RepID=A0A120K1E0_9SACH|nr:HBR376Cp [Eremothecium sinecaudum]AMD19277.1 HBR376Cp [Eremothecium sinecaudum]
MSVEAVSSPSFSVLDTWFIRSVNESVQKCLQEDKVLVTYIACGNDDEWLKRWLLPIFNEFTKDDCVWLKVVIGSEEYRQFKEMFPDADSPSVYCLKQGQVVDIFRGEDCMESFGDRFKIAVGKGTNMPVKQTSGGEGEDDGDACRKYQEEVLKQRAFEVEEKNRVFKLLEADNRERTSLKMQSLQKKVNDKIDAGKAIRASETADSCMLLIRLTNGVSLKHEFRPVDTLNAVRLWVDLHRNDGQHPYQFYRSFLRETFTDSQEMMTLKELELTPRSALILKPVQDDKVKNVRDVQGTGILASALRTFTSWWYGNGAKSETEQSPSPENPHNEPSSPMSSRYASAARTPLLNHYDRNNSDISIPSRPESVEMQSPEARRRREQDCESSSYNRNALNFKDT